MRGRTGGMVLLVFIQLVGACTRPGDGGDAAAPPPSDTPARVATPPPDTAASPVVDVPNAATGGEEGWTAGIVEKEGTPPPPVATLVGVRAAAHEGFDRVVFEFAEGIPGYHVEYVDRPVRQCGSGEPVAVAGEGWLSLRFYPAYAHDDQGRPTVRERSQAPDLPVLKELKLICDFEARVEWVLGVSSPNRYRVLELADPARLVVDIRH